MDHIFVLYVHMENDHPFTQEPPWPMEPVTWVLQREQSPVNTIHLSPRVLPPTSPFELHPYFTLTQQLPHFPLISILCLYDISGLSHRFSVTPMHPISQTSDPSLLSTSKEPISSTPPKSNPRCESSCRNLNCEPRRGESRVSLSGRQGQRGVSISIHSIDMGLFHCAGQLRARYHDGITFALVINIICIVFFSLEPRPGPKPGQAEPKPRDITPPFVKYWMVRHWCWQGTQKAKLQDLL
jgi:hypothetical protein